ncbi:uncharacterized protein LOC143018969 isoform X2 [Oratosquilla oratoria]|uniref:uncharacterized protein LOC143018969 isoform X2 n=1 Tax=Oratosquilla oratoria TaxID=337810 RepID=UPI003F76BC76
MSGLRHPSRSHCNVSQGRHHLLQKLHFRELYGEVRQCRSRPKERLFCQLPQRLAFPLAQIAPASALAAGHIFLGFTKCGQFVLSYTHSCDTDDHTLQMIHRYRLHWWLFVPYAPLRKVAEVMLFGDQDLQESVYENIFISVCQWPKDLAKILVYGCSVIDGVDGHNSQTKKCYITITAVPSLDNCSECLQVATSYEEDDLAERWNSCVRFSCLKHGITVHTSFEMVPPFPRFLPTIQMKRDGVVVLNAGNFLHVISVDLENIDRKFKDIESEVLAVRINSMGNVETVSNDGKKLHPSGSVDSEDSDVEESGVEQKVSPSADSVEINVRALRSGKKYDKKETEVYMNSRCAVNDMGREVEGHHSSDAESPHQQCSTSSSRLKVCLNTSGVGGSSQERDRDREWEILIGSVNGGVNNSAVFDDGQDVRELEGSKNEAECSYQTVAFQGPSKDDSDNRYDSDNCDIKSPNDREDETGYGTWGSFDFKEFPLQDEPQYPLYGSDGFGDQDSDDSVQGSIVSEDSQYGNVDLRENVNGDNGSGNLRSDEYALRSKAQQGRYHRSSSESSYCVKTPTKQAEKEYEFIDEISDSLHEKLSVFRRRRLADKKYEFSDENSENALPLKYSSFRKQSRRMLMSPSRSPRFRSMGGPLSEISIDLGEPSGLWRSMYEKLLSPTTCGANSGDVLRPINQNITSPLVSPRDDRWRDDLDRIEKTELQQWSSRESLMVYAYSPVSTQKPERTTEKSSGNIESITQSGQCVVDLKRRYIEVDDELVSIITDIEDDELSTTTGYHNALPLEVHGSGYTQMHMVSNAKAEKLMVPGVLIRQVSLDVEQFCHEMAQRLCNESGKKYFFCSDYNVEIIDVCPISGDIIALASVLVQAATPKVKGLCKTLGSPVNSLSRKQYKTTAIFVMNMETKKYYIVDKEPLQEEDPYNLENVEVESVHLDERWWQATCQAACKMRSKWAIPADYYTSVKVMTNEPLLKGKSLTHILEAQHLVALVLGPGNSHT